MSCHNDLLGGLYPSKDEDRNDFHEGLFEFGTAGMFGIEVTDHAGVFNSDVDALALWETEFAGGIVDHTYDPSWMENLDTSVLSKLDCLLDSGKEDSESKAIAREAKHNAQKFSRRDIWQLQVSDFVFGKKVWQLGS